MGEFITPDLKEILYIFLALSVMGLFFAVLLAGWVLWRVKRIQVPPDADFFETLRYTPLSVVILLDMLDLTLDIFSAPFAWALLGYLNLQNLRTVTVVESIIPGTQLLPTMTAAWIFARVAKSTKFPSFSQASGRQEK